MKAKNIRFLPVIAIRLAPLVCNIPDEWVDAIRHLSTITPNPARH